MKQIISWSNIKKYKIDFIIYILFCINIFYFTEYALLNKITVPSWKLLPLLLFFFHSRLIFKLREYKLIFSILVLLELVFTIIFKQKTLVVIWSLLLAESILLYFDLFSKKLLNKSTYRIISHQTFMFLIISYGIFLKLSELPKGGLIFFSLLLALYIAASELFYRQGEKKDHPSILISLNIFVTIWTVWIIKYLHLSQNALFMIFILLAISLTSIANLMLKPNAKNALIMKWVLISCQILGQMVPMAFIIFSSI